MTRTTVLDLELRAPGGEPVDLWRTLVSHGFAELAPTVLDEADRSLAFTVRPPRGRPRRVRVRAGRGEASEGRGRPPPGPAVAAAALEGTAHVLRLDQDLSAFYRRAEADPDLAWAAAGAGRMLRSPHGLRGRREDRVHDELRVERDGPDGERARDAPRGPGPRRRRAAHERVPHARGDGRGAEAFYRDVVRAGYRGAYLIALSSSVADGALDLEAFGRRRPTELPDEELEAALLALPGVGPYAAAHIMMMLGRHRG